MGGVCQQGLTRTDRAQHVWRRPPIMRLAGREIERDRQAAGVGDDMDFSGQTTA
jgi:hypothetical protein